MNFRNFFFRKKRENEVKISKVILSAVQDKTFSVNIKNRIRTDWRCPNLSYDQMETLISTVVDSVEHELLVVAVKNLEHEKKEENVGS